MADKFAAQLDRASTPGREMFVITPHATDEIAPLPKAIRADDDGTIALRAVDSGADVTITVVAGEIIPVRAKHIRITGTTVTLIHGFA